MKFRWNKKYLYWGMTAFAVICASLLFYFVIFRMHVLFNGIRRFISIMMPVICGAVIAYLLIPVLKFSGEENLSVFYREKEDDFGAGAQKNGSISVYQYVTAFCPADYLFSFVHDCTKYSGQYYQYY